MKHTPRSGWLLAASACLALPLLVGLVLATPAQGQDATETPETATATSENPGFLAAKGRITYNRYCSNCHGDTGKGDGTLTKWLKVAPADLTKLTERYDGEFPEDEIRKFIDGQVDVKTHGRREMPIWGEVFAHPLAETPGSFQEAGEARAERKILELVKYLETLQPQEDDDDG